MTVAASTPASSLQPDIAGYIYLYSSRPFVWGYKILVCLNLVGHIPMDFAIGKEYLLIMIAERETHTIEKTVRKARKPIGETFQDGRGTMYSVRLGRNLNKISVLLFTVVFLVAAALILTYKNLYSGFFVLSEINFAYCSPIIQYMYPFYFFYATLAYFEQSWVKKAIGIAILVVGVLLWMLLFCLTTFNIWCRRFENYCFPDYESV